MTFPLFPEQASRVAEQTDYLYWALIGLSAVMITIIFVPMAYFLFKYRRGKPANRRPVASARQSPLRSPGRSCPP